MKNFSGKHKIVAVKKLSDFLFSFSCSEWSGKFGKQSVRFLATKTLFFGITGFFVPEWKSEAHMDLGRQFWDSLRFSF